MTDPSLPTLRTLVGRNTLRALRRRIEEPGYTRQEADCGIRWACEQGFESTDEGFMFAMSRILYDDGQLNDGARFKS